MFWRLGAHTEQVVNNGSQTWALVYLQHGHVDHRALQINGSNVNVLTDNPDHCLLNEVSPPLSPFRGEEHAQNDLLCLAASFRCSGNLQIEPSKARSSSNDFVSLTFRIPWCMGVEAGFVFYLECFAFFALKAELASTAELLLHIRQIITNAEH